MGHVIIIAILAIAAVPEILPAVLPKANPMGALLQNILNPANSERAKQILQLTGAVNKVPTNPVFNLLQEVAVPRTSPVIVQDLPRQVLPVPQFQEVAQYPSRPVIQERVYPYASNVPYVGQILPNSPVPLVNPFLPAASPVSAIAPPTSNLLPPVDPTQVRSHFLRKIPIPPPSL